MGTKTSKAKIKGGEMEKMTWKDLGCIWTRSKDASAVLKIDEGEKSIAPSKHLLLNMHS